MNKQRKMPTCAAIVAGQGALLRMLADARDDVDYLYPEQARCMCWGCGYTFKEGRHPTRAHIMAHATGGSAAPDNFFLLCDICHAEQPDMAPRSEQIAWLMAHEGWYALSERVWRPWVERIMRMAEEAGDKDAACRWMARPQWREVVRAAYTQGGCAGYHRENIRANVQSALFIDFCFWLKLGE